MLSSAGKYKQFFTGHVTNVNISKTDVFFHFKFTENSFGS